MLEVNDKLLYLGDADIFDIGGDLDGSKELLEESEGGNVQADGVGTLALRPGAEPVTLEDGIKVSR